MEMFRRIIFYNDKFIVAYFRRQKIAITTNVFLPDSRGRSLLFISDLQTVWSITTGNGIKYFGID